MVLIFTLILVGFTVILSLLAFQKGKLKKGLKMGLVEFIYLVPRVAIGVIGSGFIAALLPKELIQTYLSSQGGLLAYLLASFFGKIIPGGPVVGFALAVGALKAGAALPVIMAFVTSWSLMALQRIFMWEMPIMPQKMTILRFLSSLPLPFIAGGLFYIFTRLV
jgi:uncharacterized membrane protein YraQ (UPF0718 family)